MRAKKILVALAFLALLATVQAVRIEDYLYPDEKRTDIAVVPLVTQAGNYSLVKIRGNESFLIKNDSFVTDTGEITSALADHYFRTTYPTEDELGQLTELLRKFNETRDGKSTYGLRAESTCKLFTGMDRLACYDRTTCIYACASTYQCGGAVNQFAPLFGAGEGFINALISMGIGYNQTDSNIASFTKNIESINRTKNSSDLLSSNVTQLLNASFANLNQIAYASRSIRDNLLLKEFSLGGFEYCPKAVANISLIEVNLSAKVSALRDRTLPMASIPTTASRIYSNTVARQEFVKQNRINENYEETYDNLTARLRRIEQGYSNASSVVNAPELGDEIDLLREKSLEIRRLIDNKNFSLADTGVLQFNALADGTEASLENYTAIKATIRSLQREAERSITRTDWELEIQNVLLRDQLESLKTRKAELDDNVSLTIRPENATFYANAYRQVIFDSNDIVITKREQAHDAFVDGVVFFARVIVRGVEGAALTVAPPLSLEEKTSRRSMFIPVLISMADLLVIIAAAVAFAYTIINRKLYLNRQAAFLWTAVFIAVLFIIAFASFSAFVFFQKQAESSTLGKFIQEIESPDTVAVIADETNAWSAESVKSCASQLAFAMENQSKAVSAYSFKDDSCTAATFHNGQEVNVTYKSVQECLQEAGDIPAFVVSQRDVNATSFATFYEVKAAVSGDERYLSNCDLARVLR